MKTKVTVHSFSDRNLPEEIKRSPSGDTDENFHNGFEVLVAAAASLNSVRTMADGVRKKRPFSEIDKSDDSEQLNEEYKLLMCLKLGRDSLTDES